jgi:hypothetical protein
MHKRWQEHRDYGDFLADFISFKTLVTPKLTVFVHAIALAGAALGAIGECWWGMTGGGMEHYLFAGAIIFGYLVWRVAMEGVMILYLIHASIVAAGDKLEAVDDRLRLLSERTGADQ